MENKLISKPEKKELKSAIHKQDKPMESITIFNGIIEEWTFNTEYIYESFILNTNSDKLHVKFPPHLGKQIKDNFNINDFVSVKGIVRSNPKGDKEIKFVSIYSANTEIYNMPPAHSLSEPEFVKGEGKITQILQGKKSEIVGFVLNDTTIIKIPPHASTFLENLIQVNTPVTFTGNKKRNKEGEVMAKEYTIIHPTTITLDEKEYLIK